MKANDFLEGYYCGLKEALKLERPEIVLLVRNYELAGIKDDKEKLLIEKTKEAKGIEIAYEPYSPLSVGSEKEDKAIQLQTALKRLGYYDSRIDGKFGRGTKRAVQALQYDAEIEPTGVVSKQTAERILALLCDEKRWVIPVRDEVDELDYDQRALFIETMEKMKIPLAFAVAIAEQEGNLNHFDTDGFVKLRCEFWGQYKGDYPDYQIRYRSFGMMQILDMGHPEDDYTRGAEAGFISNRGLKYSISKNISAAAHLLRHFYKGVDCAYSEGWYECRRCIAAAPKIARDWTNTRWHRWKCDAVPDYTQIPCGWPEAVRRYNGSGREAEAYRDEILTRIVGAKRDYVA